MRNEYIST